MCTTLDLNFNAKLLENCKQSTDKNTDKLSREIIGCPIHVVSGTSPDLSIAFSLQSHYQKSANDIQ